MGSVLDKVRQLIAMTAVDNVEEARSMAHAACKLMREHGIELSMPPEPVVLEPWVESPFGPPPPKPPQPQKPKGPAAWSAHAPPPVEEQKKAEAARKARAHWRSRAYDRGKMECAVLIKSRHEAWCKGCGVAIEEGDAVWWRKGLGVACTECGHGPLES